MAAASRWYSPTCPGFDAEVRKANQSEIGRRNGCAMLSMQVGARWGGLGSMFAAAAAAAHACRGHGCRGLLPARSPTMPSSPSPLTPPTAPPTAAQRARATDNAGGPPAPD